MQERLVLLVDDNPEDESRMLAAFVRNRHADESVVVAHDAAEARRHLRGVDPETGVGHRVPALVLMDLNLPRTDGFALLRHIREDPATRLIPVVVFTVGTLPEDVAEAYRIGANGYVAKPAEPALYESALRQILAYWLRTNLGPPHPGLAPWFLEPETLPPTFKAARTFP